MTSAPRLNELILEVTNACHHRCVHCSTRGGLLVPSELSHEERLRVLEEACDLRLFELRLLGGDPLFRLQETLELLAEANARGVEKALVYTSAVEEDLAWVAQFASLEPMCVSAEASIYSAKAPTHDAITLKPGSLHRLLINSHEARRVGFDLNWNFVWMKPNFEELESVIALAAQTEIRRVRVLRLMLNGRARDHQSSLELTPEMSAASKEIIANLSTNTLACTLRTRSRSPFSSRAASGRNRLVAAPAVRSLLSRRMAESSPASDLRTRRSCRLVMCARRICVKFSFALAECALKDCPMNFRNARPFCFRNNQA